MGDLFWKFIRNTSFQCGECEVVQSFQKDRSSYKIFISDNINKLNICYMLTNTSGISDIELHNIEFLMYKTMWEWLNFTPWSENSRKLYFTLNMVHVCVCFLTNSSYREYTKWNCVSFSSHILNSLSFTKFSFEYLYCGCLQSQCLLILSFFYWKSYGG